MTVKTKRRVLAFLDGVVVIGILVIVFLLALVLVKIQSEITQNHLDNTSAVTAIESKQYEQTKILLCQMVLFGQDRSATITAQQLSDCISKTKLDQSSQSSSPTSAPSTNTNTSQKSSTNKDQNSQQGQSGSSGGGVINTITNDIKGVL